LVVTAGVTENVPLWATDPTVGEIDTLVAPDVDQVSVELWPAVMFDGVAKQELMSGCVPPPPPPAGVTVTLVVRLCWLTVLTAVRT
jgi:hypothetical protein